MTSDEITATRARLQCRLAEMPDLARKPSQVAVFPWGVAIVVGFILLAVLRGWWNEIPLPPRRCVCGRRPCANCRKGCEALEAFRLSLVGASSHFQAVDCDGDDYRVIIE